MKYSQNNEESVILDFFNSSTGRFLDIGANDGITLSNTHALALKGWSGVCVEPSPEAYKRLCNLYRNNNTIQCIECAIGEEDGISTLYESNEHLGNGDISLLSTLIPSEINRWNGTQVFTPIEIKSLTVKTFLASLDHTDFDFISIDCEGLDYQILSDLLAHNIKPTMLCVEWNSIDLQKYENLLSSEYTIHHKNYENLIFVKK